MGSIDDISQLCRLCLVKDQVNIPIFNETSDIEQIFVKINSCLPVKVSRDDNLPKKICDGCSYKLDMLYIFRNTSLDSEKQLIQWLDEAGLNSAPSEQTEVDPLANPLTSTKPEIMVKQETIEPSESRGEGDNSEICMDAQNYIIQQQKLPYEQDFDFGEPSGSSAGLMTDEPAPKRAKRTAAIKKAPLETVEDDLDAAMQITKAEEEDSDEVDQPDYVEPSTSADDQPGPSGVGKPAVEAPVIKQELMYACQFCPKRFASGLQFHKHKRAHKDKTHCCPHCDRKFSYRYQCDKHVQISHEKQRPYLCTICSKDYKSKQALDWHIMTHTNDYPFRCDICNLGCTTRYELTRHRKVNHEGFRFTCPHCGKQFKDSTYLKNHLMKHRPEYIHETYTCQQCRKVIQTKRAFRDHMKKHEGDGKSYVCEVCGKSVTKAASLRDHMRTHTGEKPFACEVCGKGFVKKQLVVEHMRVHTKERPFKCSQCDKSFTQKGVLNIHMRHHTGEKPYKCHICGREFVSGSLLKNHKCKL